MGFENTITENDLDPVSQKFVQGLRKSERDMSPDLDVDGLSDSIVARFRRFFSFGRA